MSVHPLPFRLLIVPLLLALGCGGVEVTKPSIELAAPATGVVRLGSSTGLALTLTRLEAATGDVVLSVSGLPAGVTATFSPATLTGEQAESTLTLAAAATADTGPATVTVTATGPEALVATATIDLSVEGLTVTGRVHASVARPLVGAKVRIPGHAVTTTGADGRFTIEGVAVPYDLTVADPTVGQAHTWVGLTTAEPQVIPFLESPLSSGTAPAVVHGTLTPPTPAGASLLLGVEGLAHSILIADRMVTPATYSLDLDLGITTPVELRLHALQVQKDVSGLPSAYPGYGTVSAGATSGGNVTANLSLTAPTTTHITPVVELPVGHAVRNVGVLLRLGSHGSLSLLSLNQASVPSFLLPVLPGVSNDFIVQASAPGGALSLGYVGGVPSDRVPVVRVPASGQVVGPASPAADVTPETLFEVSHPEGGAATFIFQSSTPAQTLYVTTVGGQARLPDLEGLGMSLTPGASFTWLVLAAPDFTTADATATHDGLLGSFTRLSHAAQGIGTGPTGAFGVSVTTGGTFTLR